ncbi:hypothetical protein Goshw_009645, partial [Gossypium schwendimanii]|nr:hypothetical protein [Gossypium schwendimanii]
MARTQAGNFDSEVSRHHCELQTKEN